MNRVRVWHVVTLSVAILTIVVVIWIDIASGLWQEFVILSGLAAGLVTFLLTVLVLDRVIARSTARRWAPVSRLALSEFLHALADEERSEISRGHVVTRTLPAVDRDDPDVAGRLHDLRELVVVERRALADSLSRWAHFLASSGDHEQLLAHVADIALRLDGVRDATLEAEGSSDEARFDALDREIAAGNRSLQSLVDELRVRLAA